MPRFLYWPIFKTIYSWRIILMEKLLLFLLVSFSLVACAAHQQVGIDNLAELKNLNSKTIKLKQAKKLSPIREQAMQEMALSLGAQSGLAARAKEINKFLTQQDKQLSKTFNFHLLLLPHN